MSFAELQSIESLTRVLAAPCSLAYPVLFFGAFFETLIPFSLVVYGEVFFLAGAILAGLGQLDIRVVAVVLYAGAILGDNSSYWLGRRYGLGLFNTLAGWPLLHRFLGSEVREKGISFFARRGEATVFLARLSGPFSWFVPALAGAFRQSYKRFVIYNTLGIMIGVGEFLVIGYLLGDHLEEILLWLQRLGFIPVIILGLTVILIGRYRRAGRKAVGHR